MFLGSKALACGAGLTGGYPMIPPSFVAAPGRPSDPGGGLVFGNQGRGRLCEVPFPLSQGAVLFCPKNAREVTYCPMGSFETKTCHWFHDIG